MKNDADIIDAAFATLSDQPPRITVPARMIWLRGLARERQRVATRMLLIMRVLSAAGLLLLLIGAVVLVPSFQTRMTFDAAGSAACVAALLAFAALQMIRSSH